MPAQMVLQQNPHQMVRVGRTSDVMMERHTSPKPQENIQPTLKQKLKFSTTKKTTKKTTTEIRDNLPRTKPNVVIFTDALCPQQAPKSPPEGSPQTENCPGQPCSPDPAVNSSTSQDPKIMNKQTGLPRKEAGQTKRTSTPLILMKILSSKPSPWKKRKQQHQNYNQSDSVHKMNKPEQVILFKLRAGHKSRNAHMYDKFKAGVPLQCRHHDCRIYIPYSTANYTTLWGETCRQNQYLWWTSSVWQPGRAEEDSCFHESHMHLRLVYTMKKKNIRKKMICII